MDAVVFKVRHINKLPDDVRATFYNIMNLIEGIRMGSGDEDESALVVFNTDPVYDHLIDARMEFLHGNQESESGLHDGGATEGNGQDAEDSPELQADDGS